MVIVLVMLFILGAIFGSLLNVCIARMPKEKSIIWPKSHCGKCFQPIRFYDNIPLLSYWILRGRCRSCRARFSIRYFLIELLVAGGFVGLFYLEVIENAHDIPAFREAKRDLQLNLLTWENRAYLLFFLQRAILFCLLVVAAMCDMEDRSIPLSLTLFGTVIGLIFATVFPWPWPNSPVQAMPKPPVVSIQVQGRPNMPAETLPKVEIPNPAPNEWWLLGPPKEGITPWPVWGPPPSWMPAGSWRLGLINGLAGALAGTFLLRGVKFLFERGLGKEALGLGDADLMMMVGAFLGWQVVLVAFLVGAVVALVFALPLLFLRGENTLPFGPGLAVGTILTWLGWEGFGAVVQPMFFNPYFLLILLVSGALILFLLSFLMGAFQRKEKSDTAPKTA
jgi:leader peptidase (prepilin peptidase)/N-methyltransferase